MRTNFQKLSRFSCVKRLAPYLDPDLAPMQCSGSDLAKKFRIRLVPDPQHWKKFAAVNIPNWEEGTILRGLQLWAKTNISQPVKISLKICACFACRDLEPGDPGGQCGRPAEALAAGPVRDGGEPSPAPGGMVPRQAGSSVRLGPYEWSWNS